MDRTGIRVQWQDAEDASEAGSLAEEFDVADEDADGIRIVELTHRRLEKPPFYAEAKARGFANLPDITHMASLTFEDVLVFQQSPTDRILFHALVHAVQYQLLGLERYTELFVRGFVRTGSHFLVPLEAHAFALDSKFTVDAEGAFSVEEEVMKWISEDRYVIR